MRRVKGFEALAAFEPLASLTKRDGTLDGAVPLRVAQACVPLLEGNALGHQIVFGRRLVVRSRLGRRGLEATRELEEVDRAHRAAVPFLAAHGFLRRGGAWHVQLEKKWWWVERGVLRIWTGLLVRPRKGTWLRVSGAGSRAILGLGVRTSWIADPELARAHVAFYDAKYFATKKGEVTKKYRRNLSNARKQEDEADAPATIRIAHVAGPRPEVVAPSSPIARCWSAERGPSSPSSRPCSGRASASSTRARCST
jgi:hypothetical protein